MSINEYVFLILPKITPQATDTQNKKNNRKTYFNIIYIEPSFLTKKQCLIKSTRVIKIGLKCVFQSENDILIPD